MATGYYLKLSTPANMSIKTTLRVCLGLVKKNYHQEKNRCWGGWRERGIPVHSGCGRQCGDLSKLKNSNLLL